MSRRVLIVATLLVLALGANVWRASSRVAVFAPVDFPCLASPAAGWLTAQSDRSLLRVEWDGAGGGRVGVAPEGQSLVVWTPVSEAEAREKARVVLEPLLTTDSSDASGRVSVLVACDANLTPWTGETREAPGYRSCLQWPLAQVPECLTEVRKTRRSPRDWRAGAVGERIDAEGEKRGLKLRPREASTSVFRGPWGAVPAAE